MSWSIRHRRVAETRRLECSIEIDASVGRVFGQWIRFEDLPLLMEGVRRIERVDARHVLWDVDVFGHQVVWEAEIVDFEPEQRIGWRSSSGAPNAGRVTFEELPGDRTRVAVRIWYRPRGSLEELGARVGLPGLRVQRDLTEFRASVEHLSRGRA